MPGNRPYFEYDQDGERHTVEADTWIYEGGVLSFRRFNIVEGGERVEEEVASFTDVDPMSINKVIP